MKYIREIILEEKFSLNLSKNRIKITNYNSLDKIEKNEIIVTNDKERIIINGQNLSVKKMHIDELLIEGIIEGVKLC